MRFVFEPVPNEPVSDIGCINLDDLHDQRNFKYADYDFVYANSNPLIKSILDRVPLSGLHKHIVVDVKLAFLEKDFYPCLPGWHMDCTLDMFHETKPEIHHLYVCGADCRTRFLSEPLTVTLTEQRTDRDIRNSFREQKPKVWQIDEGKLYRYDRFGLHAPSPAGKRGKRLLVRVTETDLIRPNRRYFDNLMAGRYKER